MAQEFAQTVLKDYLILERLGETSGEGDIYLAFDKNEKRFAVIKQFFKDDNYKTENEFYEYINKKGKGHLLMKLKHAIDEKKTLVFERGDCDLKKFTEIRQTA